MAKKEHTPFEKAEIFADLLERVDTNHLRHVAAHLADHSEECASELNKIHAALKDWQSKWYKIACQKCDDEEQKLQ